MFFYVVPFMGLNKRGLNIIRIRFFLQLFAVYFVVVDALAGAHAIASASHRLLFLLFKLLIKTFSHVLTYLPFPSRVSWDPSSPPERI